MAEGKIVTKKTIGPDGEWVSVDAHFLDGVEVTREEFLDAFPDKVGCPSTISSKGWPMRSEALAVHPDQVDEANARNRRRGLASEYEKGTGVCVIPTPREKKKLVKLEGFVDKQEAHN